MKIEGKIVYSLFVLMSLLLVMNAAVLGQEEDRMKMDEYKVQLSAAKLVGEVRLVKALGVLADLLVREDIVPEVKSVAVESLVLMKENIDMDSLVKQVNSIDKKARNQAIQLLGIHGGKEAVEILVGLLKDQNLYVRRRAVYALGDAGDPAAISELENLLKSEHNPRIQDEIKISLRKLKKKKSTK